MGDSAAPAWWLWRVDPVHVLVGLVAALAALCLTAGLLYPPGYGSPPEAWRLLLVLVVVAVGDIAVLHLRFGRDQYTFTWSESSVLVGLVLLPWPWLAPLATVAVAAAHLVRRRSLVKVLFNAASIAVGTTLARLVTTAVLGETQVPGVASLRTWLALSAAAVVYFIWNSITVSAAISLSLELPFLDVVRRGLLLKLAILAGNTVIALLLLTTTWQGSTPVLVPFSTVLLYISYRSYLRAMEERDVWQQLDGTAKELSRLDEGEVAAAAVARARELFRAETAELTLLRSDGTCCRVLLDRDGLSTSELGVGAAVLPTPEGPGLHTVHTAGSDTVWLVASLDGLDGPLGRLRLALTRQGLRERDQQVLTTFVHGVTTSLQNARLYGEMRQQAERSAHEARHDSLTALPNRVLLHERLEEAMQRAARASRSCGLLLLDLDHFKEINDSLGHSAGDELLVMIARRLQAAVRDEDTVARLGGDEFAVVLTDLPRPEAADEVARSLLKVMGEPLSNDGLRLVVEGSIGVACYPGDGNSREELVRRADVALYQAKQSRNSVAHYRSDRDASSVDRLTLVAELRQALVRDELVLHFQPQVDAVSRELVGAEVLVRWQHPRRGLLGPGQFVEVAEHSGLVREFTLHILDRAVQECARWTAPGRAVRVAVNLSARNLLDPALPQDVALILRRHGLPASRLVLEITETTMMSELEVVEDVLARIRQLGVELAVDDFGTGYSSMAFLQRVAVNEIKIDRRFVSRMLEVPGDAAIVKATIELAHSLGLRVIGEGVEDEQVADALRTLGCDQAQGYWFGRPVDAEVLRAQLRLVPAALPHPRGPLVPASPAQPAP